MAFPKMGIPNGGKKYGGGILGPPAGHVKPRGQSRALNFDVFNLRTWLLLPMSYRKRCNQAELARTLGVSSPTLTKFKHDPTFPPFDKDNTVEVYAGCVWWYLRKEANPVPAEPDMLAGTESDGLERYRLARAQQEEIKLAEQRGQIVRLNDFEEMAMAVLAPYRRLAEHVKRMGNPDLWQLVEEANAEVAGGLERLYGHADAATSDPMGPVRDSGSEGDP